MAVDSQETGGSGIPFTEKELTETWTAKKSLEM